MSDESNPKWFESSGPIRPIRVLRVWVPSLPPDELAKQMASLILPAIRKLEDVRRLEDAMLSDDCGGWEAEAIALAEMDRCCGL